MIGYLKQSGGWTVRLDDDGVFRSDDSPDTAAALNALLQTPRWKPWPSDGEFGVDLLNEAGRRLGAEVVLMRDSPSGDARRY